MKINEVEERTGISKKNIRFYEEQKLLQPGRNAENGYRIYCDDDVAILYRIKLMRKLGVPLEEIRQMLTGRHTVEDGIRRHLISLEREQENLRHCVALCEQLAQQNVPLTELDPAPYLSEMEAMEASGAQFKNKQKEDVKIQYAVPIVISVLVCAFMLGMIALVIWAYIAYPQDRPPMAVIVLVALVCLGVIVGVILALFQRIREIGKGEMDDARNY